MPDVLGVFACDLTNMADEDLQRFAMPVVRADFRAWINSKRRVRDRWLSVIGRLLLLRALNFAGADRVTLADLGVTRDHAPAIPGAFCGSVSHTADIIVAVAGFHGAIGIDVESNHLSLSPSRSLTASFNAVEQAFLDPFGDTTEFVRLWTRKEALAKASGQPLSEMLDLSVLSDAVLVDGRLWYLRSMVIGSTHQCTIAWDRGVPLVQVRMVPFSSMVEEI